MRPGSVLINPVAVEEAPVVADGPRVGATGMEVAAVKAAAGKAAREEDVVVRAAAGAVTASCLIGVILQACRCRVSEPAIIKKRTALCAFLCLLKPALNLSLP